MADPKKKENYNGTFGCLVGVGLGGALGFAMFIANVFGTHLPFMPLELQQSFQTAIIPIATATIAIGIAVTKVANGIDSRFYQKK